MRSLSLVLGGLGAIGCLWVIFRMHTLDPWARRLTAILGAATTGAAIYQGLEGHPRITSGQVVVPPIHPETLTLGARIWPNAIQLLVIMAVAVVGMLLVMGGYLALKEHSLGVVRTRGPSLVKYAIGVGAYFFVAILPGRLVKEHVLYLANSAFYGITVAYVSLITLLLLMLFILSFDRPMRRTRIMKVGFFCALAAAGASSPLFGAKLMTTVPASGPIGLLLMYAMLAPAPVYYLLHFRLGWLQPFPTWTLVATGPSFGNNRSIPSASSPIRAPRYSASFSTSSRLACSSRRS